MELGEFFTGGDFFSALAGIMASAMHGLVNLLVGVMVASQFLMVMCWAMDVVDNFKEFRNVLLAGSD